jgi:hypothetical protein
MPMDWLFEDWATLLRTLVVGVLAYAALIAILRSRASGRSPR